MSAWRRAFNRKIRYRNVSFCGYGRLFIGVPPTHTGEAETAGPGRLKALPVVVPAPPDGKAVRPPWLALSHGQRSSQSASAVWEPWPLHPALAGRGNRLEDPAAVRAVLSQGDSLRQASASVAMEGVGHVRHTGTATRGRHTRHGDRRGRWAVHIATMGDDAEVPQLLKGGGEQRAGAHQLKDGGGVGVKGWSGHEPTLSTKNKNRTNNSFGFVLYGGQPEPFRSAKCLDNAL